MIHAIICWLFEIPQETQASSIREGVDYTRVLWSMLHASTVGVATKPTTTLRCNKLWEYQGRLRQTERTTPTTMAAQECHSDSSHFCTATAVISYSAYIASIHYFLCWLLFYWSNTITDFLYHTSDFCHNPIGIQESQTTIVVSVLVIQFGFMHVPYSACTQGRALLHVMHKEIYYLLILDENIGQPNRKTIWWLFMIILV